MRYHRDAHHRRSIRLRGYDYSQPGAYFITVCTHQRAPLFGDVVNGVMVLNAAGAIVDAMWREMPNHFPHVTLGEYVVMPNHLHGIVHIMAANPVGAPLVGAPVSIVGAPVSMPIETGAPTRGAPTNCDVSGCVGGAPTRGVPTVGDAVGAFKSLTTNAYIDSVRHAGWQPFDRRLWQRNYYEHIIRDEESYERIADYIRNNPPRWREDVYCCQPGGADSIRS